MASLPQRRKSPARPLLRTDTPTPTPFSTLGAARTRTSHGVTFDISDDLQQGRTAYGGAVSAIAAQAMRDIAGAGWPADVRLRALQCSFVSVIAPGRVQIEVEVLAVLLADAPATPVLGELAKPAPSSSVTWALELCARAAGSATGWWRIDSESVLVEGSYVSHAARLWSPLGDLRRWGPRW